MFERISVRRIREEPDFLTLGALAELCLFYSSVTVEINAQWLRYALKHTSISTLSRLQADHGVKFVFYQDFIGVMTNKSGGSLLPVHEASVAEMKGFDGKMTAVEWVIRSVMRPDDLLIDRSELTKFIQMCRFRLHNRKGTAGIEDVVFKEIQDREIATADVSEIVKWLAPDYELPEDMRFYGRRIGSGNHRRLVIVTNIDFNFLNKIRRTPHDITPAFLYSAFAGARFELSEAVTERCDFVSDGMDGAVIRRRVADLLLKSNQNLSQVDLFQEKTVGRSRAIASAIDGGERSLEEFLDVLEAASRFRSYLRGIDADADLVQSYIDDVSSKSWLEKTVPKAVRFVALNIAGLAAGSLIGNPVAGAAAGLSLSAFDSYLLDALARGWRPNQFVVGTLKPFLNTDKQ